ncbi:MAG: ribosomal protein S18-alanine N-acetyltransferase [Eubacteriales bacterium]|nr:ribosomal protein S18-alanine N-acetyltransferase [Eubacteriales bacterium]
MENNKPIPEFRPMTRADVPAIAELEKLCFRSPWSKNAILSELDNHLAHYHVLDLNGEIIGYAGMWVLFGESHITNVAIKAEYRKNGYGEMLMLKSMQAASKYKAVSMTLEVREHNEPAKALYYKLGFEQAGRRKRYYRDTGEDALILWNMNIEKTLQENSEKIRQ